MNHNIRIGAHVSIENGYEKAVIKLNLMGGNCMQMFSTSPRGWNNAHPTQKIVRDFKQTIKNVHVSPVYFHASYLINLADEERVGNLSVTSLVSEMTLASRMEVRGSIVHLGSYRGNLPSSYDVSRDKRYSILIDNILKVLTQTPKDVLFIIENAGNKKIGNTLEEIAAIVKDVNDERVKICLDTCHLFAAGYDLRTQKGLDIFLETFDRNIGLDKIEVWHINDSRDPFGSFRDRHENLGKGTIGLSSFKLIVHHALLQKLPFILETPGFDGNGPDKQNIDILKSLQ